MRKARKSMADLFKFYNRDPTACRAYSFQPSDKTKLTKLYCR